MRKSIEKLCSMNVLLMSNDELAGLIELGSKAAKEALDRMESVTFSEPAVVRRMLMARVVNLSREVFGVIYVDSQNRLIKNDELFFGCLGEAPVYPRVVVENALLNKAKSVILWHNHPSGVAEPSRADRAITERLSQALGLIDVKVLDHFVVSGTESVSFAERGWL
jgi:DNA repair protein RadC